LKSKNDFQLALQRLSGLCKALALSYVYNNTPKQRPVQELYRTGTSLGLLAVCPLCECPDAIAPLTIHRGYIINKFVNRKNIVAFAKTVWTFVLVFHERNMTLVSGAFPFIVRV
jgi:hypothetical protein